MTYPCCGQTTGHATWCTSTPRMLAGETVTYTTVTRHVWRIETIETFRKLEDGQVEPVGVRYRWSCPCSVDAVGQWKTRPSQAEQGAKTHARRAR